MSFELKLSRLDQIAQINPKRRVTKGVQVPFVEMAALPQNFRDIQRSDVEVRAAKSAGAHFKNGDTLLARITPCLENGKTAQVSCLDADIVGEGSTEFIVLCGIDPEDNDFVYYLCRDPEFRKYAIGRMEGTSGRQRVSWQSIAAYEFLHSPPKERRASTKVLAALDDRITLLRETNATLEEIAQALFKSWFVDFDPVRAKQGGGQPEGMDAETAALFPNEFQQSELGEMPKGWEIGTLNDVANLNPETWGTNNQPKSISYIDLANAKDNNFESFEYLNFTDAPSRARRILRDGDTIIGTVRPGNRSFAFIRNPIDNLTASTGFAVLRPIKKSNAEFIFLASTQDASIEHLAHIADGGAYPAVRPNAVSGIQVFLPPDEILLQFHKITEPILLTVSENQNRAKLLADLRDAVVPRLISGQLRLPDAEQQIEVAIA